MNRHARGIATLVAFVAALVIGVVALATDAHADAGYVVTTKHGVVKHSTLRDCRVASSVPCSLFGGLDSGWLDSEYTWHSVWMHGPRGHWRWATKAEQLRYRLTPSNQVQRRHGVITWFRGPTGETWANVPGSDSEHWPDGQAPR